MTIFGLRDSPGNFSRRSVLRRTLQLKVKQSSVVYLGGEDTGLELAVDGAMSEENAKLSSFLDNS